MGLQKYWQKRDFKVTPEPRGDAVESGQELSFVIQRHAARRLHYDFRLELDGVLKSWAVPKGPNFDPSEKRLAVRTEDHPMEYASFEGEIPAHEYGGGHVIVWDRGSWTPVGDPHEGLRKGNLKFELHGEKLAGRWVLVRLRAKGEEKENWLLIKERDEYAKAGTEAEVTELAPESVLSGQPGRRRRPAATGRAKAGKTATVVSASFTDPKTLRKASTADLPEMIRPQLATLVSDAPSGEAWLTEFKFDGYRALTRVAGGKAKILTRAGNDWTAKWPAIARAFEKLPLKDAWFDGEVVALDDQGAISFQKLQNWARGGAKARLVCYVFDLMYADGVDLRKTPLVERKQLLREVLEGQDAQGPLFYSEHVIGHAQDVFRHACDHEMEGIVVKRVDSAYQSVRSNHWLKVKCELRQEFVVAGYTDPAGSRSAFGALLLGVYDDGELLYAGRVGTGFDEATLADIARLFPKLETDKPAYVKPPRGQEAKGVHWLKPKLVAEVRFAQWTDSGYVRHASFVGLRSDKKPEEIRRENPQPATAQGSATDDGDGSGDTNGDSKPKRVASRSKAASAGSARSTAAKKASGKTASRAAETDAAASRTVITKNARGVQEARVAGVRLTHPERVMFEGTSITKLDLAHYYEDIADWILPHLKQRPLTLVRCPNTSGKQCFYQKHANNTTPEDVERIVVADEKDSAIYMTVTRLPSLIALVQMGVLELHTWGAHGRQLMKPDRMIFDLDPAPDVPWKQVIEGAQLTRALLDEIGLQSFVKTTGGKGLHVVVPIKPERTWDEIKPFTRAIATHLEAHLPDRFIANMAKKKRVGKIFVDYLRNGWEATAIAAYSTRSKPGAPVSVPLAWDELSEDLKSDQFTVDNVRERLSRLRQDPWEEYYGMKQRVTAAMLRMFGLG